MGEFWDSLHLCNRKTESNKCNEMDDAIHCWTFPFDVVHTKPGLHRDPPKQHTLSKGHTWMELREPAPSTQKAASTRGTHLLSLQTLPCTPELTKPWLVFLHHPWLWSTPSRNNQMKTGGAHKPRGPHERPPGQLALCTLYNFSKQGPLKPRGDQCSTTQTEGVSLNRMHTGMDLSLKRQSKTSLPSPPENGTTTPTSDDGLVFYYCNKKLWPGYYRRKGLFGLIVLIRVHYRHGGWSRSCWLLS